MRYKVEWQFPEGHEDYREFGDNESFTDEGFAYDCFDQLVEDGAVWVRIMQIESYRGIDISEKVIDEYWEEQ